MNYRILWLENNDLYTVRRGKEVAERLGAQLDYLEHYDITFVTTHSIRGAFFKDENIVSIYDAIIIRSFMPFVSESITLARLFREAGKVVLDVNMTDEGYAMSKMHDYLMLADQGIPVPHTKQVFDPNDAEEFASYLGYPCVLKKVFGSEGRHVYKVNSPKELRKRFLHYKSGEFMVQEFLPAERDYRVMVVGYEALPFYVSRKPEPGDFRTNFELHEDVVTHPLSEAPELQDVAERAARALRREFSGVDIRYRGSTPLVLEANRRPGFKGFEKATGYDVAEAFIRYVIARCKIARGENGLTE